MDEKEQQRKDIFDRLEKLPPELKDVMFSTVTAEKMFDIGKRHGLLVDKLGDMAHETGLLMLGVTHPDAFVGNLAARLEVDKQKASALADDINREILSPVHEHLRSVFGGTAGQGEIPTNKIPPGLPFSKGEEKSLPLLEKGVMGHLQGNSSKPETTLEDLEAELEKVLAEQKGEQPLSVVKQQPSETISKARDIYKGADPYREQIEEHIPNVRGAPYVPLNENKAVRSNKIPPGLPFPKGGEKSLPPLEKGVMEDLGVKNASLQAFRGFNMNNLPKQQPSNKNQEKEEQQPQQQKPASEPSDLPRYGFSKNPVPSPATPSAPKPPQVPTTIPQPIAKKQNDPYKEKIE